MPRSPEEQDRVDAAIAHEEAYFQGYFRDMDPERFVEQGVSIFRTAADVIPSVNEEADAALRRLITALVTGEAPVPEIPGAGRTAIAWRMYTGVLVEKVAEWRGKDFREVHVD